MFVSPEYICLQAAFPTTTPVASTSLPGGLDRIRSLLEAFRLADRTMASDEDRLVWVDEIREIGRRVAALTAVLVSEADEAGCAMRVRHSRLEDWMARSGQETPRDASRAVWAARVLERHPKVRDAAAAGRISLGQAKAIGEALDGLPSGLDHGQRHQAEQLILTEADHTPAERLRLMTEQILRQVAPSQVDTAEERAGSSSNATSGPGADASSGSGPRLTGRSSSAAACLWLPDVGCRTWSRPSPTGATGQPRTLGTGRPCNRHPHSAPPMPWSRSSTRHGLSRTATRPPRRRSLWLRRSCRC